MLYLSFRPVTLPMCATVFAQHILQHICTTYLYNIFVLYNIFCCTTPVLYNKFVVFFLLALYCLTKYNNFFFFPLLLFPPKHLNMFYFCFRIKVLQICNDEWRHLPSACPEEELQMMVSHVCSFVVTTFFQVPHELCLDD